MSITKKDIHQHVEGQSGLLSAPIKPPTDFFTLVLDEPHNVLHIFCHVSDLVLLRKGKYKLIEKQHTYIYRDTYTRLIY